MSVAKSPLPTKKTAQQTTDRQTSENKAGAMLRAISLK